MTKINVKEKLLEEIKKTGFPFELRVSKFLSDQGYYVANNLYYVDLDEEKGRELDMRALKNFEVATTDKILRCRHCLVVECKRSSNKPWVVFTSDKTSYDHESYELVVKGQKKSDFLFEKAMDKMEDIHPYAKYKRRGRGYFEAFKSSENGESIFKALTTATKATIALKSKGFAAGDGDICFYYPIILFDGELYESYLHNGDIAVERVDSVLISFYYESPKYRQESFSIPIVTEAALPEFSQKLDGVLEYFGCLLTDNLDAFG